MRPAGMRVSAGTRWRWTEKGPGGAHQARRRAIVLSLWAGLALAVLAGRLFIVQVLHGRTLALLGAAERGATTAVPLPAMRGEITDRNGQVLALSVAADRIIADPALIPAELRATVAARLGGVLTVPEPQIAEALSRSGQYAVLQDGATEAQGAAVQALGLPGITVVPSSRREYPDGFFLGSVLGFVNANGGAAGVEQSYNAQLAGTNGYEFMQTSAIGGDPIPGTPSRTVPPRQGLTLQLTIDAGIQAELERQIEAAVATTGAKQAYGIVMQPSTGAILAAAAWPTFDPNAYGDADASVWANTVQGRDIVPGSVFKTVTAAAALQEGIVGEETPFTDPGYINIDGTVLHNFEPLEQHTTFLRAFEESANVVFAGVGLQLGAARFYQYLQAFGLLQKPGSDLPAESLNIFVPQNAIRPLDLASEAFGETLAVTPLALITAVNVIADGGVLIRPHVGQALLDPATGRVVQTVAVDRERQVLSPAVAATVRQMMAGVVEDGTGQRGFIPCYDVGGKTGTANIYGPTGVTNHFIASFVAFAPAEDPAAIALVMIEDPQGPMTEGGEVAAPVVQAVLADTLHALGVAPHCTPANQTPPGTGAAGTTALALDMVPMPAVVGLSPAAAQAAAQQVGIRLTVVGSGPRILRQNPEPNAMVQKWTTVQAYTSAAALLPPTFVPVPAVVGKDMAAAAQALTGAGFAMDATGSGTAIAQNPPAGTPAAPGSSVSVSFGS